jgi:hypothetical protein
MINIFKIFKKTEFSDFEKIVLKMCNGKAPLHNIDSCKLYFQDKKHIYGIWFANGVDSITLYEIDGAYINKSLQEELAIHKELRIKLWDKYGELYEKFKNDSQFKQIKDFEEKYGIKITK